VAETVTDEVVYGARGALRAIDNVRAVFSPASNLAPAKASAAAAVTRAVRGGGATVSTASTAPPTPPTRTPTSTTSSTRGCVGTHCFDASAYRFLDSDMCVCDESLVRFAELMKETREGSQEWATGALLLLCGAIVMLSRLPANRVVAGK
jgi:hypothetical protein